MSAIPARSFARAHAAVGGSGKNAAETNILEMQIVMRASHACLAVGDEGGYTFVSLMWDGWPDNYQHIARLYAMRGPQEEANSCSIEQMG